MNKLVITAAICGAEVTKKDNPYVPYTIEELAIEAYNAKRAGASIIHLHVREDDGTPTQSKDRFKDAIRAIKAKCGDIIIQPSTGGAVGMSNDERLAPIVLNPEMCTLDCGTVNFGGDAFFKNTENDIIYFSQKIYERGIFPELECFGKMHLDHVLKLHTEKIIKAPLHFSFVLGTRAGQSGTARDFHFLVDSLPENATYTITGIGKYELSLAELAIINGGHVRVGLEDNIYIKKGQLANGNAALVKAVVDIAKKHNRAIASVKEARQLLNLKEAS
ncbi:MAG: 3-keto-5-aminohexanoate cleavage protein [Candidatus Izimaplasma sp.]|nr:3-keto-5-aminohexanoate cleavage protein [Candidatus Izimaplasma bacterium]